RGESAGYLKKAEQYILAALANADTNQIHDLLNVTWGPSIFPVEAYFELKLTLLQVLSIAQKPKEALALADRIEAELKSPRVLVAQRSDSVSAEGYLNRLYLLRAFAGIYNPEMSPADGLVYAMKAHAWAKAQHEKPGIYLAAWEMSKKDLKYDTLLSLIIMGRLYPKLNQFDAARKVFQQAFAAPEAVRREEGFLDIGLQSFYGLANIALADSESLKEAAEKFDEWVDWNKITSASHVDFRESMGMIIKKETLAAWLSGFFGVDVEDIFPSKYDPEDVISEIEISDYKTPLERLKLAMKLIDHVDIPYDQKEEVMTFYNLLADLEEVE
ncbi:MAG: hypothetical protein KKA31_01965, partial [Candidatus Margulisbacteria bacterium]|nr:hypothetical protein [Candidatus Margulisiibacteriota bacterium]